MTKRAITKLTKRILPYIIGVTLSAFLLLNPIISHAYGYNWDIDSFDTNITVNENGIIRIVETIVADYSQEAHHGIFRLIPVQYRDSSSNTLKLRYEVISVKDEVGNNWWYETSRSGDYLNIKAGDPDKYQNQPTTFVITYEIQRAISHNFDDHDELYWNATGDEWEVPIERASATITLPDSINQEDIRAKCYTGSYGSSLQNCESQISGNSIFYESTNTLESYEGLTIAASFPKGIIQQASFSQRIMWFFEDNWPYLLPFITFGFLFFLWWTRGRDPSTHKDTIMPIYTPPEGLTPSEIGTIIDEKADMHDINATIIDMAVRGYLKIIEEKGKGLFSSNKYTFEKLKKFENDKSLKKHEQEIMKAVFGTKDKQKLSALKNKFYKDLPNIKKELYKQLQDDKYFPHNPDDIRNMYLGLGGTMTMIPFFIFGAFIDTGYFSIPISIFLSGIMLMIFSRYMPKKTKKGVETYYKILGLEEFIRTAEKDRIKWQEKENMFMKLLPYAMALQLADKWSNAFKGLEKTPDWFQSNDADFLHSFNALTFVHRLNSFSNSMDSTFNSAPRSSSSGGSWSGGSGFSGGFSGGGFGGGGGGSW